MVKVIIISMLVIMLTGCDPSNRDMTSEFKLPPEMQDCKLFSLSNGKGAFIEALVCPNATTSTVYKQGKTTQNIVVRSQEDKL